MKDVEIWIAIASLSLTFLALFWKTASIYGDLKYQVKQNREDISRMGNSLREQIKDQEWEILSLIEHIQEHLTRESNYYPPPLRREDK
jgi:hypothetical protein